MVQSHPSVVPLLQRVLHPTDFSEAGHTAFAHALIIALIAKAKLTILHVSGRRDDSWADFPGVRDTLERWGLLPKNSERTDVAKLGIEVQKMQMVHDDPVESITAYLETYGADLVVLATDQRKSGVQWLNGSVAANVARKSREMTLFIPKGAEGFVSLDNGAISLRNILIPIAPVPSPQPAAQAVARLVSGLRCDTGTFTLLHVGEEEAMPQLACPKIAGWRWNRIARSGEVIEVIHEVEREIDADLIAMATDGRNGFLDVLRGSHSERVLQETRCPLLTIPADGFMTSVL
jgi:nucleotide-binding universal stress UspA family protein